ncbi:hypothetical protein ACFQZC_01870 [Streptacidiphilus monticola]
MTLTGTGPAVARSVSAAAVADHLIPTVTSGDARFEILSPTLIRTEYAGDGHFTDDPTFNAIGRDAFAPAAYATSTSNGWLTITTSKVELRYKIDSGPFDADNLSVRQSAGGTEVTASPWQRLTCSLGALCEAESLQLNGGGRLGPHRPHGAWLRRRLHHHRQLGDGRRQCHQHRELPVRSAVRQLPRR